VLLNSRLSAHFGLGIFATAVSFLTGLAYLTALCLAEARALGLPLLRWRAPPRPHLLLPGVLGVAFVTAGNAITPLVGSSVFWVSVVVGTHSTPSTRRPVTAPAAPVPATRPVRGRAPRMRPPGDAKAAGKTEAANIKVLRDYATREPRPGHRRIVFRFCTSPVAIKGAGRVEEIVLGRNELLEHDGRVVARDTGERETHPMNLVVRAVGYHGVPVPGLPFDDSRGTIPHTGGKVIGRTNDYVTGWIKRGPSGVIGTNKSDSQDTVENLWEDLTGEPQGEVGADYADELAAWLAERQPLVVTDDHWQQIDAHERSTGEPHGRPRVKVVSVADLLRIAHG
jgi:NADPH-dependent glutamate synthase beta subunit-like oxidoreductase